MSHPASAYMISRRREMSRCGISTTTSSFTPATWRLSIAATMARNPDDCTSPSPTVITHIRVRRASWELTHVPPVLPLVAPRPSGVC